MISFFIDLVCGVQQICIFPALVQVSLEKSSRRRARSNARHEGNKTPPSPGRERDDRETMREEGRGMKEELEIKTEDGGRPGSERFEAR